MCTGTGTGKDAGLAGREERLLLELTDLVRLLRLLLLLRLVFLSSSLRHHLEDKILGTSTGAARLASGHNAEGYVLDDSDSKENQLSKAVSRKSALTPNARSTRSAPRVGADDRARGGRELVSLTVVALKERCAAAGLKKTGRKADLIARLRAHADAADGEH